MKIGLLADLHYSSAGLDQSERRTAEGLTRLAEFIKATADCDFLINLGDLVNGTGDRELDRADLRRVLKALSGQPLAYYHVIGNHDLWALPREELVAELGIPGGDYSFKRGDVRFIVLDANYAPDGSSPANWTIAHVSESRLVWLKSALDRGDFKLAVVICHHCLDDFGTPERRDEYAPDNAAEVRAVVEASGKVPLVLTAHYHKGRLRLINGVTYYTQPGMCEGDDASFGILTVDPDSRSCGVEQRGRKVAPRPD